MRSPHLRKRDVIDTRRNDIWAPKTPAVFEKGQWQSLGNVRYSTMANETDMERETEYLRAKDLFYKFTSRDRSANYE